MTIKGLQVLILVNFSKWADLQIQNPRIMKIDCLRVCVCVHVCLFIYISNKIQNLAAVFLDSFSDLPSSF